ncbi:MAG: extracellular solute-binding protein [Acidimicrobiia bacterium]|nr:extracellular solute-binding protein [Acidimicrobiia bacterium]MDH3469920.1 extracellular solute-binding protein [Acidimicrobiia bacterium]
MRALFVSLLISVLAIAACSGSDDALTVYSGRSETLVGPLIDRFEEETGIEVAVRYAGSTELAATLAEEGSNSPADVFFAQDPASLGLVALEGLLAPLPSDITSLVSPHFSDSEGRWVGTSGRARVLVMSTEATARAPSAVQGLIAEEWKGRLGIAPSNGSFLAFVAAMVLVEGEESTKDWLDAIAANDPVRFEGNAPIVAATAEGTIDGGLVNHYYLRRLQAEQGEVAAENWFFSSGAGALVMPAGAGILASSDHAENAAAFVSFLLSEESQAYFVEETFEYPTVIGIDGPEGPQLDDINSPSLDLSELASVLDLATDLVAEAGLL